LNLILALGSLLRRAERKGIVMGMDDESDPGKDVSGRWIGGLAALVIVIWVLYMLVIHGIKVQLPGQAL
jgi:hypothetical protein